MKRNYLFKNAKYTVVLKNFQDEFLRNMMYNLYKNGTVSLSNSKDFFDEGVFFSTEDENRAILGDIYNLLIKPENRTLTLLKDGEIENVTVEVNIPKQETETKPTKKRGRPKGSKNRTTK